MKKLAADLGLDTDAFNQCLDSGKFSSAVQEQNQTAQSIGVRSTPSFLVNGQPVVGAQPFEQFKTLIEAEQTK